MFEKRTSLMSLCQTFADATDNEARSALILKVATALSGATVEVEEEADGRPLAEQFSEFMEEIASASTEKNPKGVLCHFKGAPRPAVYESRGNYLDVVDEPIVDPLLRLRGSADGDLLPVEEVGVLTGAGGTGKSTLASDIALAVAGEKPPLLSPIEAVGSGEVLWVSFEERLGRIAARMKARVGENDPAIGRIRGVALGGRPMFGPAETKGGGAFYNARPKALPGWDAIDAEIDLMREPPRLVVLDPALAAFVGEPNAASPVREFITELKTRIAEKYGCAVLLIAHATKSDLAGPFDRILAGGSAAWTDAPRACLTLTHGSGGRGDDPGARTLAVLKANAGPAFIWTPLTPDRPAGKWIVGFKMTCDHWLAKDEWKETKKRKARVRAKGAKANGAGLRANGGATNGAEQGRKNGGEQDTPQSGVGNGSGDDTLAV